MVIRRRFVVQAAKWIGVALAGYVAEVLGMALISLLVMWFPSWPVGAALDVLAGTLCGLTVGFLACRMLGKPAPLVSVVVSIVPVLFSWFVLHDQVLSGTVSPGGSPDVPAYEVVYWSLVVRLVSASIAAIVMNKFICAHTSRPEDTHTDMT